MINIINSVIGSFITVIFGLGVFSNIIVKKKYQKMFRTMNNKDHDKHLLIIERDYRHGYLKDRVERIKIFVEKEYYEIKIMGVPLYTYEDFTISSVYFVVLLGLTFTFILIALPTSNFQTQALNIFFLSIVGLLSGITLIGTRIFTGTASLCEIFKVNLCDYLEHELELFDEVEEDEKINFLSTEATKANKTTSPNEENSDEDHQLINYRDYNISASEQDQEERLEVIFDERILLQVVEEILG